MGEEWLGVTRFEASRRMLLAAWACGTVQAQAATAPASLAAASVAAAPYLPTFKPIIEDIGALVSLGTWILVAAGLLLAARFVRREWLRHPLVVEPFDVPKDLQDLGLNGNVISQQIYDAIVELQQSARPDDGHSDTSFIELPRLQVDLQLPGTSWSIRGSIRYFKHVFGRQERRLMGEVCRIGMRYAIRIRNADGQAVDVAVRFHGPADLGAALRSAAESALVLTSPLEAAGVFLSIEGPSTGYDRTVAALRMHIATAPAGTHQDAYVLWASVQRNLGDEAGMQAKLDLARSAPRAYGLREGSTRLGARFLNFVGSLHRERREFQQAEKRFSQALHAEAHNLAALSNLGLLHLDSNDLSTAQHWFERVIARNNRSGRGYRGLGLVADRQGDLRAAIGHLTRAIDVAPRSRWVRANHCEVLRRMGQWDEAERSADALQQLDPSFPPQYRFRSRIYRDRGEFGAALLWATRACELDPTDPWAWAERSQVALAVGDADEAVRTAREAIRLRPLIPDGYRWAAQALASVGRDNEALALLDSGPETANDVWSQLDRAQLLHRRGEPALALKLLTAMSHRWPRHPDIWRRLAAGHRAAGDWGSAESCLWTAVTVAPKDVWSWGDLGDLQRQQGRLPDALRCVECARVCWSHPARALRLKAQVELDRHQAVDAERSLREAMTTQRSDVWALLDLVDLMRHQERYAEALSLCAEGLSRRNQPGAVLRRWALVLQDTGDTAGAQRQLSAALAVAGHDPQVWIDALQFHRRAKNLPQALRLAETALARWPRVVNVWVAVAQVRADMGDLANAHAGFEQALALEPESDWIMGSYVGALWSTPDEALQTARQLVERRPGSVDARLAWARQLSAVDLHEDALRVVDEAVAQTQPHDLRALLLKSKLQLDADATLSLEAANAALARNPRSIAAMRSRARALHALGEKEQALGSWREAAVLDTQGVDALLDIAEVQTNVEAQETLTEALASRPGSVRIRRVLLNQQVGLGDAAAARHTLDALQRLLPAATEDLLTRSHAVVSLKLPDAAALARQALDTALARQPTDADVLLRSAQLLQDAGQPSAARDAALRARDAVPPSDHGRAMNVAQLLVSLGAGDDALALADVVVRSRPP